MIFHFDHERIPERVVHARGYGAHGYFECTDPIPELTSASPFQNAGQRVPAFVRFSRMAGNKGSFDLARDVRGFAVKMYTEDGNNIPVFFIQDAMKFPDLIHSIKEAPDRAIPRSFRFMDGFGVHTFRLVNAEGKSHYVKFHWKPKQGLQSVVWDEAVKINGADPDFHRRDLWDAIQNGDFPEWELGLQIFDDEFADKFDFDVLDATRIIPEDDLPIRVVGRLVLDRTVDNFFAETEQVAFCTQNIIPGIDFTNDPLLQGRNFSYLDTQTKRLGGPNFTHIPINAPKCPFHHFQQDGHMAMHNPTGRANYEPNSWSQGGPRPDPKAGFKSHPEEMSGHKRRLRPESFADHYSQARQFYISQTPIEQDHIVNGFAFELSKCEVPDIRTRILSHLRVVDEGLAASVADALGHELPEPATPARAPVDLKVSDKLSILKNAPDSFAGRKLGILVSDGADRTMFNALTKAVKAEGGMVEIVAPKIGGVTASDGSRIAADQKIDGGPSVLYDAVALVLGADGAQMLGKMLPGKDFVSNAFGHCKFIAMTPEADALLQASGVNQTDDGMITLNAPSDAAAFIKMCRAVRFWDRAA